MPPFRCCLRRGLSLNSAGESRFRLRRGTGGASSKTEGQGTALHGRIAGGLSLSPTPSDVSSSFFHHPLHFSLLGLLLTQLNLLAPAPRTPHPDNLLRYGRPVTKPSNASRFTGTSETVCSETAWEAGGGVSAAASGETREAVVATTAVTTTAEAAMTAPLSPSRLAEAGTNQRGAFLIA